MLNYSNSTQTDSDLAISVEEPLPVLSSLTSPNPISEWTVGSAIALCLTQKWLTEIKDPKQIATLLNWKSYNHTGGWYVRSVDPITGQYTNHGQFKPSSPLILDDKPQKYFSFPKGKVTEPIFAPMTLELWRAIATLNSISIAPEDIDESKEDLGFWLWVLKHPELPISITEGAKKAGCLLSNGEVGISVSGVWNGQQKGKLHPSLLPFITPGRPINLVFDSDVMVKTQVEAALIQFGRLCKQQKALVAIVQWDLNLGKGIDDLIVAHGEEKFKKIMGNAVSYGEWLKTLENQFSVPSSDSKKKEKLPPADELAFRIAEDYRDKLAYNNETSFWMRYEADFKGVWSKETEEYIEAIISSILDGMNIKGYGSHSYIINILKKLRCLLIERFWNERNSKELIPFRNGVLETATKKFLPHSPGYRFTWALPRDYNPLSSDWSNIDRYLSEAVGRNERLKNILLCYCNAVLLGRSDLQKFLHLIGPGGTGKGTFMRLLTDLIGLVNLHSTTLEDICTNRFELANIYKKRLVVMWDEDKKSGNMGRFKSLTGEDYLRAEEKGKKAFSFKYDGMVVVSSNFPIFVGDNSSGLARRLINVPFSVTPKQRKNLNQNFQDELAAFTNYLLSLEPEFVTATLLGLEPVPEISLQSWEQRIRTDSIASWLNDCVIFDACATTAIGSDRTEGLNGNTPTTLYGSYALHCHQNGTSPKANKNFSPDLLELCNHILGMVVEKTQTKVGKFIKGMRLRTATDFELPTLDYQMQMAVTGRVTGQVTGQDIDGVSITAIGDGSITTPCKNEKLKTNSDYLESSEVNAQILEDSGRVNRAIDERSNGLSVTNSETLHSRNCDPSPDPSPNSSPTIDYSSYPHRTSDDIRAKQNKAHQCKEKMLSCHTSERLAQFKSEGGFSETEIKWVYHRLLTPAEQEQVREAASVSQLSLFEQVDYNWQKAIAAIDSELERLGWSVEQAKEYLLAKYNKRSRQLLDNEEIIEFWQDLRKM
jgi:P4 family phage/plasmid primase-like protien